MPPPHPKPSALVTGGSSGIGYAIARMLGQEGYSLTLVARSPDKLEAAAQQLRDEGADADPIAADVSDPNEIARAIREHKAARGGLDVLVNNAGVGIRNPLEELTRERLELHWRVNVLALVTAYQESVSMLRTTAASGRPVVVINVASVAGKIGQANLPAYSATKAAVIGFTESMNRELGPDGIRSTALCPAYVDTPMADAVRNIPDFGEMLRPEDCAEIARMLLRLSPVAVVNDVTMTRAGEKY
jgi:NAD(P)-dependent dehydrogenase (short-subunit alcohol dehydrogenase family)